MAEIVYGRLNAQLPGLEASITGTVRAIAEAVHPRGATVADYEAALAVLLDAIQTSAAPRRVARQVEERAPLFRAMGRYLRTPEGVMMALSVLLMILSTARSHTADRRADSPPSITVQIERPDRAEVERIVEERLCELGVPAERDDGKCPG